ncbi:MAG: asparagine synthase (glutamine-hydrolyzing) [Kiritimatiellia bacterium]
MCGICGFNWNDPELVARMADQLRHRGPDQRGIYTDEHVSLGHRRLSIIDLSENGRQPMTNEDGTVILVFNGEIYNFQQLRNLLEPKGHAFRSQTDSEVIIHGYEEYGTQIVEKLRGMFAFAIWDRKKRILLLVRDRIGIKPLYYYWKDGRLIFASEIKAILEDRSVSRELDPQALYDYLGFEFVPAPATMFRGISKLPAGHYLILCEDWLSLSRYWEPSFAPRPEKITFSEAVERERALLDEAVSSHLVSDVPLGVLLSGGLDSSLIVAMMRRHVSGQLRTFTIGYPDETFSELDYAQEVAERFETDHHVLMIDEFKPQYIEQALWHLDEPMTDLSTVPLLLACQQAREHVTVCLSGEGGDESYAGYDRFKASRLERYYRLLPRPLRKRVIAPLAQRLPDQPQKKGFVNTFKRFIEGAELPEKGQHLRWQFFLTNGQDRLLFKKEFQERVVMDAFRLLDDYLRRCDATDVVNREIYLDLRFMMTNSVLMKVDKMSMANSLEIRVPLLDHVLVEFLASLPGKWKLNGLETKHILRAALRGLLPDRIVNRGKQGYSLPVKQLLRTQLKSYMIELLHESPLIREHVQMEELDRLISEHLEMKHNHNHILWALMNVAIWQQRFGVEV